MIKKGIWTIPCIGFLLAASCNRTQPGSVQASGNAPATVPQTTPTAPPPSPSISLPEGTKFRVRLLQELDTERNRPGDRFTASLDEPLVDGDRVVVPKNTTFTGHLTQCKPSGRFKGRAVLALELDSFELDGQQYSLRSTQAARTSAGHKKHHFAWIGGGSGGGAVLGAIAGGGTGALIGAGAGAAAGTVGSAITGKREIRLPVETPLSFTLRSAVEIG